MRKNTRTQTRREAKARQNQAKVCFCTMLNDQYEGDVPGVVPAAGGSGWCMRTSGCVTCVAPAASGKPSTIPPANYASLCYTATLQPMVTDQVGPREAERSW